jgi:DNA polymerase III subunit gamma/tau
VALALYRKYRPATFAEVVGQEHVTEPLMQALASGRVNHAYLFSGPRGCGKTSSARILARSLNCETRGPTPDPCGKCDSCVALAPDGPGSLDVIEIDAASHGGVDDARDLRERAFFAPVSSRYKVYIVDEAHMVSTQGFNALLKLVEEPPEFLVFVFATTEPDKVLTTIRSRTHHYPFRLIPPGVMRALLSSICTAEGIAVEPTVLPLVVRAGGGSARDALSVLDQLIAGSGPRGVTYAHAVGLLGVTDGALLDEMVDALAAGDSAAVYESVDRVVEAGYDPRRFATDLLERLRDLVVLDAVPDANAKGLIDCPPDQIERMTDQAARLGTATLSRMADIVHTGLIEMRGTTSPRLLLELVSARMLLPAASSDGPALLQRLERMERRLSVTGDAAPARDAAPVRDAAAVRDAAQVRDAAPVRDAAAARDAAARDAAPVRKAPARKAAAGEAPTREAAVPGAPPREAPPREAAAGEAPPREAAAGEAPPREAAAREAPSREAAAPEATAPEATAPEAARPHTPVGDLDAAAVRRIWPEVLDNVKRRRRTAHALLMNVSVQSVDNGVLTLTISSIPLSRLLAQDANTDVVRSAVRDVLGVDWRINVVVDGGGAAGGGGDPGAPPPDDDPRDDEPTPPAARDGTTRVDPEEAAISLLQSTLGAKRMEN